MKASKYNIGLYNGNYGYWYNALNDFYFRLSYALSKKVESLLNSIDLLERAAKPLYDKLYNYGFIIADDVDELQIIRNNHYSAVHSKDYFLIILPTLNCNFKCWYCIQDHIPSVMSENTFQALKRHLDYMIEEEKITSLHIDWFGGEPFMFFRKIIEPFSRYAIRKCEENNIQFINTATTNGYFINQDISSALSELKFRQFQITLDGEKEYHDSVKFMKGCQSAFEHVLRNIDCILSQNIDVRVFLRINYTHKTLSRKIVSEVNTFISEPNRIRITVMPKKVWQESVDKDFGMVLRDVLNDFELFGYVVARRDIITTFTSCYVNKKYYNAVNFNGNVFKCTACDDIRKDNSKGKLLNDGRIIWEDGFDVKCQSATFENERCLNCNKLPLCMGLCPRDYLLGATYCKYDKVDQVFEDSLLDYLKHSYNEN